MEHEVEILVEKSVQISSLPYVFLQINEAVENPESSFADIGRIISGDPALSVRLLRIVNSSFFGFQSKIETITHAITIVGMEQLRDLVLATTVISFFKGLPKKNVNMESFWYHSVACGLAARTIAIYRKESNAERFYVIGLLHDLGRLILYLNYPEKANEAMRRYGEGGLLYEAEREMLGFDHAELGGALMKKWDLPARIEKAVRFHHDPSQAREYHVDAAIVHVADIVAHSMQCGDSGDRYVPPLDSAAWDSIQLPSSLLSSILAQVDRQLSDAIQMFLSER